MFLYYLVLGETCDLRQMFRHTGWKQTEVLHNSICHP